jgi:hypothetical protein
LLDATIKEIIQIILDANEFTPHATEWERLEGKKRKGGERF